MSAETFADVKKALEDALAFERGERRALKTTRIYRPRAPRTLSSKRIARVREASKQRAR